MTLSAETLLEQEKVTEEIRSREKGVVAARALAKQGFRLCMQGNYTDSLAALHAAVALVPNDPALLNNLAVVLERVGQTKEAIDIVEYSLTLVHGQKDSWLFLGNLKAKQGDLGGARVAYETAIALERNSPLAWQGLGLIKQRQNEFAAAIECFRNCIKQSGASAPLLSILGQLYYATGQFAQSRDAYAAAIERDGQHAVYRRMHREMQFVAAAIQGESLEDAINTYELERSTHPVKGDKNIHDLLHLTFALASAYGHKDVAQRVGAKWVALFPASATAAYLLHALAGNSTITRSPDAYIVEHFDEFADEFEHKLVNTLGYDIPAKLGAAVAAIMPAGSKVDVLDAGCGTGLCGPHVVGFCASLTGVDLSSKMLEHARRRNIYDRLNCCELTEFLTDSPSSFDVIIAADVMIYFGDLTPLATAIAKSLKAGGLLAFSTERATAPRHQLLSSGRFAHDPDYVQSVFGAEFEVCQSQDTTLRLEAARPVSGNIFVFRRR